MKKTTLSHKAMYQNVLAVLNDQQQVWNEVPGIVGAVNEFRDLLNKLSLKLQHQSTVTQGIRLEKNVYLKELIVDMSNLKKGLFLYSIEINDLALRERNHESKAKLTRMSPERLEVVCLSLLEDLEVHGAELGTFGISDERIQQFQVKVEQLENRKNSVRQAIIERSLETNSINTLEKQINRLLIDRLDRLISLLNTNDNTFEAMYKSARKVIDTGHSGHRPNEKNAG